MASLQRSMARAHQKRDNGHRYQRGKRGVPPWRREQRFDDVIEFTQRLAAVFGVDEKRGHVFQARKRGVTERTSSTNIVIGPFANNATDQALAA
jgi:hypothetical protein